MRKRILHPYTPLLAATRTAATFGAAVYKEPGMIAPPVDGGISFDGYF